MMNVLLKPIPFPAIHLRNEASLISPHVDFLTICGGLMWCLFIFHQFLPHLGLSNAWFGAAALLASVMLAETHVMATLVRLYESPSIRVKHPFFLIFGPALILALMFLLCSSPQILGAVTVVYLFSSVHHGLRQSYGICMLYCLRSEFKLNDFEKRVLSWFLHFVTFFAICRQLTYEQFFKSPLPGVDVSLFQVLPQHITIGAFIVSLAFGLLFLFLVRKERENGKAFPWLATVLILNSVLVVLFSREIAGDLWIFVPGFFHGSQYLAIVSLLRVGQHHESESNGSLWAELSQYFFLLLVLSFLVYGLLPRIMVSIGVRFYTATAAVFLAFVLHHFISDALIWRLKDPMLVKTFHRSFSFFRSC